MNFALLQTLLTFLLDIIRQQKYNNKNGLRKQRTANKGFAIVGLKYYIQHLCFYQHLYLIEHLCLACPTITKPHTVARKSLRASLATARGFTRQAQPFGTVLELGFHAS